MNTAHRKAIGRSWALYLINVTALAIIVLILSLALGSYESSQDNLYIPLGPGPAVLPINRGGLPLARERDGCSTEGEYDDVCAPPLEAIGWEGLNHEAATY